VGFNAVEKEENASMGETIRVQLARSCDGDGLVEALTSYGFAAQQTDGEIEVRYARDESERLANDVCHALEAWLSELRLPLVPTDCGDQTLVLRPPGD
jgi:hypothetical protein